MLIPIILIPTMNSYNERKANENEKNTHAYTKPLTPQQKRIEYILPLPPSPHPLTTPYTPVVSPNPAHTPRLHSNCPRHGWDSVVAPSRHNAVHSEGRSVPDHTPGLHSNCSRPRDPADSASCIDCAYLFVLRVHTSSGVPGMGWGL
jgi:hypothetical protein